MQSIGSIIVDLRKAEGCIGIDFQQDNKDNDKFHLRFDWENIGLILLLLKTKNYNFLQGAMEVLCEAPIVKITNGIEPIKIDTSKKPKISMKDQIMAAIDQYLNINDNN